MNRGSADGRVEAAPQVPASMRPRFMNRGSTNGYSVLARSDNASMRPRFMNRGSRSRLPLLPSQIRCFNEAPIHESGKWTPQRVAAFRALLLQ